MEDGTELKRDQLVAKGRQQSVSVEPEMIT
jgi:hypothetical protein